MQDQVKQLSLLGELVAEKQTELKTLSARQVRRASDSARV